MLRLMMMESDRIDLAHLEHILLIFWKNKKIFGMSVWFGYNGRTIIINRNGPFTEPFTCDSCLVNMEAQRGEIMFVRKGMLVLFGLLVVGACLWLFAGHTMQFRTGGSVVSQPDDGGKNNRYASYVFGTPEGPLIDVGYQPISIPSGTIPAVMMRDRILLRQLDELGKSLKFHPFLEGGDINTFLFSGALEFMWAGDMPVIKAAANIPIVITAQVKTAFASVVARHLFSMDQLKGRRIGVAPGSSAHQVLLHGLALNNLVEKDVQLVKMPVNQMIDAMKKGTIDAFAIWEPTVTLATDQIEDLTVLYRALTYSYLYFSKSIFDGHPEIVKLLTAANLRAVRWMGRSQEHSYQACQWHIALAEAFLKESYPLSVSQCQVILNRDLLDPLPMTMIPPESLQPDGSIARKLKFLQQIGILDAGIDPKVIFRVFRMEILQEIVQNMDQWRVNEFDYQ